MIDFYNRLINTLFVSIPFLHISDWKCILCELVRGGIDFYHCRCYNLNYIFYVAPKCSKDHSKDTHPCHELCGGFLCSDCCNNKLLVPLQQQCPGCDQHTCHLCIDTEMYRNCCEYDLFICKNGNNECSQTFPFHELSNLAKLMSWETS
jgi:hypothetical protein